MTADPVDLFVGQLIALLPKLAGTHPDAALRRQIRLLFPRADGHPVAAPGKPLRPRTYSLITDGRGGGFLTAGGSEIPVTMLTLDVTTPPEATAFQIVAMAGRALRVRGIAEGDVSH